MHLLIGPSGSNKTGRLVELASERTRSRPGSVLYLGPSQPAVGDFHLRVSAELERNAEVHGHTFWGFLQEIVRENAPGVQMLSGVQRRLLLEEIVAELRAAGELRYFGRVAETRGFLGGLVELIAELKRNEVRPLDFARACYARRYAGEDIANSIGSYRIGRKERETARLYAEYQRRLARLNLCDADDTAALARELIGAGKRRPFEEVRVVCVDGFTRLTPAHLSVLTALTACVEDVWVTLLDEPGDEREELFRSSRSLRGVASDGCPDFRSPGDFGSLESSPAIPSGLAHLRRQIFRPLRKVEVADDAQGVELIEAPGMLGEARLVARSIKQHLKAGVAPRDIVVVLRDLTAYVDLLREVFAEYEIDFDLEGEEALTHNPAIAILLRACRLFEDDWPFAGVTALLRNNYFRPDWADTSPTRQRGNDDPSLARRASVDDPSLARRASVATDLPQKAEALLRLLAEPRGREAYLRAVDRWASEQQPGLEDEQAEESRRRRIHDLAKECEGFLHRFFRLWDDAPSSAPLRKHVEWLGKFVKELGIARAIADDPRDLAALERFWQEIAVWLERERSTPAKRRRQLDRRGFHHRLTALASEAGLPRSARGPERVRILSAESACHVPARYVYLMGLSERSFPQLASLPFFDEQERQSLANVGIALTSSADQFGREMLLFYQIITRVSGFRGTRFQSCLDGDDTIGIVSHETPTPDGRLVFSYPAVDDRGQELLPSSFLAAALDCFAPEAVPTQRRRMLIEGYLKDPLSQAEWRVQLAARSSFELMNASADLQANLVDASRLARQRLNDPSFSPYEGLFEDTKVIGEVARLFGPEKIFSPTALEDYVACPFKFFLRHVLKLEPLEEPREEIEVTRRGQAVHRALARLHRKRKDAGQHTPDEALLEQVLAEMQQAIDEDVKRAPSDAAKQLWSLEGQRLRKLAERYPEHWNKFVVAWQEKGIAPAPHFLEVDFGLPPSDGEEPYPPLVIRTEDIEVRISGRIDRVDVAQLEGEVVFWIVDYKTGRGANYTSPDLENFRKLQLTLYALAVEKVLLADQSARPLGLAYWIVAENGPKVVLPARKQTIWLEETTAWKKIREDLERWITTLVGQIRSGIFVLEPRSDTCTQTCPYGQVCRITQARAVDVKERDGEMGR